MASAKADYLIACARALLDLLRRDTAEGRALQKRFRLLKIVDPVIFLNESDAQNS